MTSLSNPHSAHIVKSVVSFMLVMASVSDITGQDDCPYDLNGDGLTGANELLFFMSDYGVAGNTDYDFNDNGFRDFEDALMLSRYLGTDCPQTEVQATTGIISGLLIEPVDTLQQDLFDANDTIPAGAITFRLYAVVTNPEVTVVGVWGNAEFPLTLNAPDGLFFSSLQTSDNSYFASNISPVFFPIFPTYDRASWWTLNHAPGDDFQYYQPLSSSANFMDDMDDGSIQFDADMGDGWFVYDYINTVELPTASNLKLLGQFTTLGQSGICGQLNLEIRTHFDGAPTQFEQAYELTFSTPGAETLCQAAPECPEGVDINGDGLVATNDLLQLLEDFGTVNSGPSDINGDGTVNVSDVLTLLGSFGMVCG